MPTTLSYLYKRFTPPVFNYSNSSLSEPSAVAIKTKKFKPTICITASTTSYQWTNKEIGDSHRDRVTEHSSQVRRMAEGGCHFLRWIWHWWHTTYNVTTWMYVKKHTVTEEDRPAARACFHCYPTALRNSRNWGRQGGGRNEEDDAGNSSTRPESPGGTCCILRC